MMASKVLLLILPLSVLCYNLENVENKPYSDLIKVDKIVLNNIEEGKLIGCKYQDLCSNNRVCYNDQLFGTCVRELNEANFIYELAAEFQNILELAMRDLFEQNYKWGDFYTQCFLQSVLISSELQQFLDVQHCKQNPQLSTDLDPTKLRPNNFEMKDEIVPEIPRMYPRTQSSQDSESFYKNIKSLLQQIQDKKRVDSNYENKEMINPKSNSEEANSITKVDYADPKIIRKVLKVAKRRTNDWVWLKFDKKITKIDEPKILDSIINSLPNPVKIGKTELTRDKTIISFKILPDSSIHSKNVTDFFNNHKNIIPGFTILETGSGKKIQSSITAEEIPSDQNFIITLIICSVVFLGVILVLIGFCVQKFRYKRDKLGNILKSKFSENSSASYKELFRVTTNKDTAVKAKQGVARMNSKQHSGETPAASSPVSTRSSTSSWTDEMQVATNMDIYTGHMILTYMEKHLKNKEIFQSEWNSITSYEAEDAKTETAIKIENLPKNRFQDKIPYDKSRVVLKNQKNGDYINASLIVDHDPKIPVYIASQAPLEKYVADFWQMVWEQGVVVIVNLTETNEVESSQYWPKEGSQIFNIYEVNLVSEHIWSDEYLVRNFYLKNLDTAETRTVTQFHFVSWPVDKLPNSSRSILEFRRKVNKSYRSKSTPIIIHCNDGCGRTGTYILLDLVLNRICKGLKEMDIAATLEHLRDQRMNLVKTEDQFGFVLTTISEEVNNILKILNQ